METVIFEIVNYKFTEPFNGYKITIIKNSKTDIDQIIKDIEKIVSKYNFPFLENYLHHFLESCRLMDCINAWSYESIYIKPLFPISFNPINQLEWEF